MAFYLLAAIIVLADQVVKTIVTGNLELGARQPLIPGIVDLTRVHNTGASFGMLADMRWALVAVSSACSILLIILLARFRGKLSRTGLALALGGAVGNLVDRVLHGYVVDMFDPAFMSFYVFNIADSFIVIGAIVFFLSVLLSKDEKQAVKRDAEQETQSGDIVKQSGVTASTIFGGTVKDLSETKILEEYDIERQLLEYKDDDD